MNQLKLFEDRHEVMILTQEDVNINFKGDFLIRVKDVAKVLEYKKAKDLVTLIRPKYICLVKNSDFAKSEIRSYKMKKAPCGIGAHRSQLTD